MNKSSISDHFCNEANPLSAAHVNCFFVSYKRKKRSGKFLHKNNFVTQKCIINNVTINH